MWLAKGDMLLISPDEWAHAIVFKVAADITNGVDGARLRAWENTLLSTPAICMRLDSDDKVYAEANSLRQQAVGYRRAVEHSARQFVYNIWGLKLRKEQSNGDGK